MQKHVRRLTPYLSTHEVAKQPKSAYEPSLKGMKKGLEQIAKSKIRSESVLLT